jgi:hypothetical protein
MPDPTQRHDIATDRADGPDPAEQRWGEQRRVDVRDIPDSSWNEHDGSFEWGPETD